MAHGLVFGVSEQRDLTFVLDVRVGFRFRVLGFGFRFRVLGFGFRV